MGKVNFFMGDDTVPLALGTPKTFFLKKKLIQKPIIKEYTFKYKCYKYVKKTFFCCF